ncbi:MAG: hypothetical protein F4Z77_02930 [Dehalococcoidia bacterium]|nr:hypothetical protein [Chloroflexota bacterium]MXW25245.1 hypothetical protein [Dehalococcoidia bacterium]MXZ88617.1 hypothetical protein [Dehalococcoidia bacterium]MYA54529.1 hypothetical protein [Dehalococcoidia bacterium]MYH67562.1 hypothetical protein [Dehalococcoidia bacterium]
MIVLLEEPESWSLMMLVSAVAIDNADISFEGKEAIRRWRSDHQEGTPELESLTEALNERLNSAIDAKLMRRVKSKGRYETVRR